MTDDQLIEHCLSVAVADRVKSSTVWREVMTAEDREDARQDARVDIWQGLASYEEGVGDGNKATRGIYYGVMRLKMAERAIATRHERDEEAKPLIARKDVAPEPDQPTFRHDGGMAQLAAGAARHLPPTMALAVNLRFGLDSREPMTHEQIAEEMGVSQATAWRLVRDGLQRLRAEMRVDEILRDERESD